MEALSWILTATMDQGLLTGLLVGSRDIEGLVLSHLLFTDDTLIFRCAHSEQIHNLCCIYVCFEAVSRLRIYLANLKLFLSVEVEDVEDLAHLLGCRVASLPMKYLGLLLGASFWMPLKRTSTGELRQRAQSPRVGGKF
jgi:hypothetical protein